MNGTHEIKEPSWSDHIRNYKMQKTRVPWAAEQQEPRRLVTRYAKAREERRFDPILQRLRNPEAESKRYAGEAEVQAMRVRNAQEKAARYNQTFNIVSNESHVPLPEPHFASRKLPPNTRLQYNILSNEGFDKHHHAHPDDRPKPEEEPKRPVGLAPRRDFNPISNKYTIDHDRKTKTDHLAAREIAAYSYWQTHDYDPIRARYYDGDKEKQFLGGRNEHLTTMRSGWREKLPPTMRQSEGNMVDIVNFKVKDEEAFRVAEARKAGRSGNRATATDFELRNKRRADERYRQTEERQMNRVADQRYARQREIGYDIVTNEKYFGNNAKQIFPSRTRKAPGAWQRCQSSTIRGGAGGAGSARGGGGEAKEERRPVTTTGVSPRRSPGGAMKQSGGGGGGAGGAGGAGGGGGEPPLSPPTAVDIPPPATIVGQRSGGPPVPGLDFSSSKAAAAAPAAAASPPLASGNKFKVRTGGFKN